MQTIDWDKPVETTFGIPCKVHGVVNGLHIVSWHAGGGRDCCRFVDDSGQAYKDAGGRESTGHEGFVRNKKTKREGWIKLYRPLPGSIYVALTSYAYASEDDLLPDINDKSTIIRIEWEE